MLAFQNDAPGEPRAAGSAGQLRSGGGRRRQVRPVVCARRGASRRRRAGRPRGRAGICRRPVRRGHRAGDRRAARPAAGRRGGRARPRHRQPRHPLGRRAPHHAAAWNDTARTIPHSHLPELFAQQAARTPDAVALVFGDATLSYRELDTRSNQLAHHLRTLGAGPETIVGLCVERSFDMVVALLGILKAGAAYLPLDPDYPQERLQYMLADAGARLLAARRAAHRLPASRPRSCARRRRGAHHRPEPNQRRRSVRLDPRHRRLRHLHLGLDRHNRRASPSRTVASPITGGWHAPVARPDDPAAAAPVSSTRTMCGNLCRSSTARDSHSPTGTIWTAQACCVTVATTCSFIRHR